MCCSVIAMKSRKFKNHELEHDEGRNEKKELNFLNLQFYKSKVIYLKNYIMSLSLQGHQVKTHSSCLFFLFDE